jgi:hypothetical protein
MLRQRLDQEGCFEVTGPPKVVPEIDTREDTLVPRKIFFITIIASGRVGHENLGSNFILETTDKSFMEERI